PATGRDNWRAFARSTAAHSTLTCHETSSCQFIELPAMKRMLQGAPIVSGPSNVGVFREAANDGIVLTASHDAYARQFGVVHQRSLTLSN
ncbi:heparinase II/III domain-containing protein, partial [Klebsiella aerogenes]|uniref:heparinase II/III domain-containing protein n=1 Tax=Klebsiella aerogenes TaxID=548 RepID=UPI00195404B7